MRNLIRATAAAVGVAVIVFSVYLLGGHALNSKHYVQGVLLAVGGAVLVTAALRALKRNEPVNPVMIIVVSLLVILGLVIGMVF